MRRVLITSPTYSGEVQAAFAHSLGQTLRLNYEAGYGLDIRDYYPRGKLITVARNECVAEALKNGFDDLVWIDGDQDWKPAWFFELLGYPVDCVGAPVRKKDDAKELYNVRCDGPNSFKADPDTGLWIAPRMTVGCGFLRMSRLALEALWHSSPPYEAGRWIFDYRPTMGKLTGEDTAVCYRLLDLDIPVWLAPHMNPGHYDGMRRYEGNFIDFVRRWKAEQQ